MAQLYFRYGAMGCGKTMQLLQVAFNYEERGQKVCVIKPATDTKNGTKRMVSQRKRTKEFFKSQDAKYGKKLNAAYLKVAKEFNIPTLDAFGTQDEVFKHLKKLWSI